MDFRPAKQHFISSGKMIKNDHSDSIKRLSSEENNQQKRYIVITKCLYEPCPRFYTDTISESVLIECKDPRHQQDKKIKPQQNEIGVDRSLTQFAEVVSDTKTVKEVEQS